MTVEFKIQNYGQNRELNCTDQEQQIYDQIVSVLSAAGLDTSCLVFVRKSDDYVSCCMRSSREYGDMDIARFKFTDRAKWIKTGERFNKYKIATPADVQELSEEILWQYQFNEQYL